MNILTASTDALQQRLTELQTRYNEFRDASLSLDITRGKPAADQLDLSNALDGILEGFYLLQDGTDVRNYGGILGIPEARELGGEMLGVASGQVMAGGNSSLTLMYNYIAHMLITWREQTETVRFLCPVPGYDRHFTICESFGIEMINVGFDGEGPDMDEIFRLCEQDPSIKGIWCVPKYSNPTGHTYSAKTVRRFAELPRSAGDDFRIMWDNAYAVHHLTDNHDTLINLMDECTRAGTADSAVMLASTSKITFAGAGVAFLATSESNLKAFEQHLASQVIGWDKVNQLRHVRFLPDLEHINAHMEKHAALIRPKFDLVEAKLKQALDQSGIATWTRPNGGYFVSLDTSESIASQVVKLAADIGVKLTPAGATFPYGHDPADRNIRIAPTFPPIEELDQAMSVFVVCLEMAAIEHQLQT